MSQVLLSERAALARRLSGVDVDAAAVALGSGLLVGGVSAASGGYFPTAWGWTALILFWATAVALLLRRSFEISVLELIFLGALILFAGWVWLETLWSDSAPSTFLEGQRVLVYVAGVSAGVLLVRKRTVPLLLGSVLTAITLISGYSLATRLFPDRIGTFDPAASYRLDTPLGYWNALGILAAMAVLLGLGFAARGHSLTGRALGAASVAVTLPTVFFTYGRGTWIALGLGALAVVLYERHRLQLITAVGLAAAAPAASLLLAYRSDALTHSTASLAAAVHDGKRFALAVVVAAAISAASAVGVAKAEQNLRLPSWAARAYALVLLALVAGVVAVGIARYGSPPTIARKGYNAFVKPYDPGSNLNSRLFQFSGSFRSDLWRAAWHDYKDHRWLGSGPGTFEQQWLLRRQIELNVKDGHSLYVEQLAEVGPFGLALLALALTLPFVAAIRARGRPLAGAALGAYVAFVIHAAADWDWEMPAVTLTALLCAIAIFAAGRSDGDVRRFFGAVRSVAIACAAALAVLAFVGLVGNLALSSSRHAVARHDWAKAASQANRASDWAPWSSEALDLLGQAQLQQGKAAAAAASFRQAIAKDPRNWALWLDLYSAASGAEAKHAFRRAYQLNPEGDAG